MFALVDCNNFYVSCERVFNPAIEQKPVIVLSNNDGCVISRSAEAKSLGIPMGAPVFQYEQLVRKEGIHVLSTNYSLYGNMSERVMTVLAGMVSDIEVYSIDEAFLDLSDVPEKDLLSFGKKIKERVFRWTGIPVSVGIASTKTLAKAASYLAKKKHGVDGVCSLITPEEISGLLPKIKAKEVWGIGQQYALFFQRMGIETAQQLRDSDEMRIRENLGVMVQRIILELRGVVCYPLDKNPEDKKEICTSRSFGRAITSYEELEEATTTYAVRVAQKLREQKSLAQSLLVFVMTNKYASGPRYVNYRRIILPQPTNQSFELIHYSVLALKSIFRKGYHYKKSGVVVSEVIPESVRQISLWEEPESSRQKELIQVIDRLNSKAGNAVLKWAVQGTSETWKMRQNQMSPHYTTRWKDILMVNC